MRLLLAIFAFTLAGAAAAQPTPPGARPAANKPLPPSTTARVEATVLLVGCASNFRCGRVAAQQEVALVVTKVVSGTVKVGDSFVMGVLTCGPGPLLYVSQTGEIGLDAGKIRSGSKIDVELDIGPYGNGTTTDKIRVLSL